MGHGVRLSLVKGSNNCPDLPGSSAFLSIRARPAIAWIWLSVSQVVVLIGADKLVSPVCEPVTLESATFPPPRQVCTLDATLLAELATNGPLYLLP
jgi:hypothetical protein